MSHIEVNIAFDCCTFSRVDLICLESEVKIHKSIIIEYSNTCLTDKSDTSDENKIHFSIQSGLKHEHHHYHLSRKC